MMIVDNSTQQRTTHIGPRARSARRHRRHRRHRPLSHLILGLMLVLAAFLATTAHAAAGASSSSRRQHKRIKLDAIRTLTFYKDERTTARRTRGVPQLTCVGKGSACRRYQPDVVQCSSMGDWQWKCEADLPEAFRLGKVEVSCEGWDSPDDPYVLSGSCGLTYNLIEDTRFRTSRPKNLTYASHCLYSQDSGIDWSALFFWAIFLGVLYIIVSGWLASLRTPSPPGASGAAGSNRPGWGPGGGGWGGGWWPGGGGGGGGGGRGGQQAPPPPYSKDQPSSDPSGAATGAATGWRPGFWTGLAAGVIGDRLFNGNGNNNGAARGYQQYGMGNQGGGFFMRNQYGGGGGARRFFEDDDDGFGGGGGGIGGFRGGNVAGPSRSRGGTGGGSGMGNMRRSTGFGGTNNR
ncbi:hypothetical protein OC835_005225 [Tilletia horrida]|nr:hypothetical protein OC835_005225 [Tilletia horrida]